MRLAFPAERRASELEASALGAERAVEHPRRLAVEALREAQLLRVVTEQARRRLPEQPLTGRVDQHQPLVHVEREDRHVDGAHDALQQRGRFHGFGPLALKRVAERVDLDHDEIDARAGARAGAADGVVPLAQRAEEVRLEQQHPLHHLVRHHGRADPDEQDERRQRPADLERVVLSPREVDEREPRGEPGEQDEQEHRVLEAPMDGSGPHGAGGSVRVATHGRHTAGAADRAHCGSSRAGGPPAGRRRRAGPGLSR